MAAFQAFWGKAYAYFLLKTVFMLAVAFFELGSLICGKVAGRGICPAHSQRKFQGEWLTT
jgi:hypothetical protein